MSDRENPAVARLRLRHALRSARDSSDLTQEQVAASLEWSLSKVIRIENGSVRMTITDMRALLQLYGVREQAAVTEMEVLARTARAKAWWAEFGDLAPKYANYIGLEEGAAAISCYQQLVIPGLLQTESYARAVVSAGQPQTLPAGDDYVSIRLRRQERVLRRTDPPRIHAVLDEATLRRINGGVAVQREQLHHLVRLGARPNIQLQVLPFSAGLQALEPAFVLMSFPYGADHDVVYLEFSSVVPAVDRGQVLDREEDAGPYRTTFDRLAAVALGEADSLAYIAQVAGELR
ncbi:transcriptional regulator [Catellatospora sp. TT07R-123]|uniref:helix-turn-helix domain-containing protein n=1 Tax=Catellatospora sp. TT07R-123 TaxID=2733863 RepID=UPI001B2A0DF3|nr:helix-turn-helix transcriptional regulator [Catellatospora sp. TT07R-123]GHJ45533.1 transcriptional regulator [Catellatospora sp. TT07R-123]